jgi:hypothetical protein
MIAVAMRMHDKKRKAHAILEKRKDSFCQWDFAGIGDGTGVDQQRLLRSNEQIKKISFRIGAETLAQDESLRLVSVDLQGRLGRRGAILGTHVPLRRQ